MQGIEGAAILCSLGFAVELSVLGSLEVFLAAEDCFVQSLLFTGGFARRLASCVFLVFAVHWRGVLRDVVVGRVCALVTKAR